MMTLKIRGIEQLIPIDSGNSCEVVVESPGEFFRISKTLFEMDENEIVLYDIRQYENKRYILVIQNLFDLNPNNKKILSANYQYASNMTRNTTIPDQLIEINSLILSILDEVSTNFNNQVTYNEQLTLNQLLETYEFKFDYEESDFISTFVSYIKALSLVNKYRVVITFNLQDFLDNENFKLLIKELGYIDITLINFCSQKSKLSYDKSIIIDKDLCEI